MRRFRLDRTTWEQARHAPPMSIRHPPPPRVARPWLPAPPSPEARGASVLCQHGQTWSWMFSLLLRSCRMFDGGGTCEGIAGTSSGAKPGLATGRMRLAAGGQTGPRQATAEPITTSQDAEDGL